MNLKYFDNCEQILMPERWKIIVVWREDNCSLNQWEA